MSQTHKKLIRKKSTTVQVETGEITKEVSESISYLKREPDFIKLYLQDLLKLKDLQSSQAGILYALLQLMTYSNQIILNASVKREIAGKLGVSVGTIDNTLSKLKSAQILTSHERGIFVANPFLFARGDWTSISNLRMQVSYDSREGRSIETTYYPLAHEENDDK